MTRVAHVLAEIYLWIYLACTVGAVLFVLVGGIVCVVRAVMEVLLAR